MAFVATNLTNEPRAFSIGPIKQQIMTWAAASGDTSGTVTADGLSSIVGIMVAGINQSAAPTFSGNVATLTLVDPAATVVGTLIVWGR